VSVPGTVHVITNLTHTRTHAHTVRSESRGGLRVRFVVVVQGCIDARGHKFQYLQVHSDFPNALCNI
jgi:hypothetical protein